VYLAVLTAAELALAFELPISRNLKLVLLPVLAVWKAPSSACSQHLKSSVWNLRIMAIIPLPLALIFILAGMSGTSGSVPQLRSAHHAAGAAHRRAGFYLGSRGGWRLAAGAHAHRVAWWRGGPMPSTRCAGGRGRAHAAHRAATPALGAHPAPRRCSPRHLGRGRLLLAIAVNLLTAGLRRAPRREARGCSTPRSKRKTT